MKLTTTGEIQTIINNDDFQGNGYWQISFFYYV
jgi:hypothetical protein